MRHIGLFFGVLTITAVLLGYALALPALAGEAQKDLAGERKQPEVLAEFNIEKGGRHILLPVRIQERDYLFALDTGASVSVFDIAFSNILGKPIRTLEAKTAGDPVSVDYFNPPEAFIGKLDLRKGGPVSCMDLDMLRRVIGKEVRGLLGMGFLKNYVLQIDFDSGKIWFCAWDGLKHPEWGSAVRLYTGEIEDSPYISGRLKGVGDITFLVDSGDDGGDLVAEVFVKVMDKRALAESLATTVGGTHRFRETRLSSLGIGGFEHRGVVMGEGNGNRIGLELLSRYVVTLDFPSMKMYFKKGQAFDKRDETDMSGLHLWRVGGLTAVHSVDKDSPAEAAGIKAEDVVLKFWEKSAIEMDIEDLRDLLKSGDGKEIKMTIKRGGEEKAVSFKLKRKI